MTFDAFSRPPGASAFHTRQSATADPLDEPIARMARSWRQCARHGAIQRPSGGLAGGATLNPSKSVAPQIRLAHFLRWSQLKNTDSIATSLSVRADRPRMSDQGARPTAVVEWSASLPWCGREASEISAAS